MKQLDQYVLREIMLPFMVGLGLFFVLVIFAQMVEISDSVTGLGISSTEMLRAVMYSIPPLLGILLPVSGLFATMLAMGRLTTDGETLGMYTVGISPQRLLVIPMFFGAVLAVLSAYVLIVGEPWGLANLKELMARSAQRSLASSIQTGQFVEWVSGVTFYAEGERDNGEYQHVLFSDQRNPNKPIVVAAQTCRLTPGNDHHDMVFQLKQGTMLLFSTNADASQLLQFERCAYRLDIGHLVSNKLRTVTAAQSMRIKQLWQGMHDPQLEYDQRALYTIVFHRKMALPLAAIIFAMLAVPLANRRTSNARARGFLYSTMIVGAYYYIGRACELAARSGHFPPWLAAWAPNLIGVLLLLILLRQTHRTAG